MQDPLKQNAQEIPSLTACIDKYPISFQELDLLTQKIVKNLEECGVKSGDIVAVQHPTSIELIALFFASWRLDASICPISTRLPLELTFSYVEKIQPKLFIQSFPFTPQKRSPSPLKIQQSALFFTSGSTGTPKVAVLSLDSLLANASFSAPLRPGNVWLMSLPLFHVGGVGILLRAMLHRATIALHASCPHITHLSFVPTQLYRASPIYPNLECILLSGAPISHIPSCLPIYAAYGLTEMGSSVVIRKHPPFLNGAPYLGMPLPKREIKLSEDGEIWVRGECLFDGYLEQDAIVKPLIDGWFPTGDLGKLHPEEGITITGRKDFLFISGGENIQPEEIEMHLLQIPYIVDAAVLPKPDPEYGYRPIAFIQTEYPYSLADIQNRLRNFLPKYKIPIALFLIDESAKNGLKINKKQLIKKFLFS